MRCFLQWAAVLTVLAGGIPVQAAVADVQGTATVVDGDTLEIHDQRIQLFGIDAPRGPADV
jgi:endonuclease YncB( thermonuclease family)